MLANGPALEVVDRRAENPASEEAGYSSALPITQML